MTISGKKKKEKGYHAIIRDVFVCSKSELAPFATAFSFPPENFEQQKFGALFGAIKVNDHSESSSYVVNLLVSVIRKEYFSKPHRSPEESFEASLRKANLALAELARHGVTSWAGKINFAGGAIERNNLHFACLGSVSIFLIRGNEISEISEELEEEKEAESHPLKTFSNISSGKLEVGDKLVFTTNELVDIFSPEELRQNASHFSREELPGFFEISLQANSELAGTIIVDLADSAEIKPLIVESPIIGKEKAPKYAFSAPAATGQAKKIDSFVGAHEIIEEEEEKYAHDLKPSARQDFSLASDARWKKILVRSRNILQGLGNKSKLYFSKIQRIPEEGRLKEIFFRIPPIFSSVIYQAKNIDWKNRKIIIQSIVVVAILAIGLYGIASFVKKRSEQKRLSQQISAQPAEPTPAVQNLDDVNVKNIETAEEVANFSQNASQMALLGNSLYVIPEKSNSILKIDPSSKNIEEIKANLAIGNFKLLAAMPHLGSLFFLTEDNKIVSFTPINKNFQENGISLPGNLKAADMKTYLTYLYFLDPGTNQVYRYPRAEGGFGEMQSWLRSGADVKSAKSFAINGDLFAASSSDITAYLQGKTDSNISFEKPSVPLSIDKIFSEPDMEGVYVLDSKNHRIVKYGKDGKIISQYFNTSIVSVKDFSVDEKNKVVYLLKNNQLLKFSME